MKRQNRRIFAGILTCTLALSACSKEESSPEIQAETATQVEIPGIPSPDAMPDVSLDAQGDIGTTSEVEVQHFGMFMAETMDGREITDSIFGDYELTMVNIWATWCSPCVEEMPYLQEVYSKLPENVNLVTMVSDGDTQGDLARQILDTSGATFDTILPSDSIKVNVFPKVEAFPTTVFVDRQGNVAAVVMGVPAGNPADAYLDYIDQLRVILAEMGGYIGTNP